jgi:hypothetical protein
MHQSSTLYVAASIPRFIRNTRLAHLRLGSIIGSWAIENPHSMNIVYDVVMLPADEFARAMTYLAVPAMTSPALRRENFNGAYSPKDIKQMVVDGTDPEARQIAVRHFVQEFKLNINRTIYEDNVTVVATVATRDMNATSCTRMMSVPRNAAMATKAAVPSRRSLTGLLRAFPMKDFREGPSITGYPSALISAT